MESIYSAFDENMKRIVQLLQLSSPVMDIIVYVLMHMHKRCATCLFHLIIVSMYLMLPICMK